MSDAAQPLTPALVEGELRISDLDLGERLGFAQPVSIRKLIRSHEDALRRLGVLATAEKTPGGQGGRPGTEYLLNQEQAIFITAKSDTPNATEITLEIVRRFTAYERGDRPIGLKTPSRLIEMAATYRAFHSIARTLPIDRNQQALAAARATRAETGVDPLAMMEVKLVEEVQAQHHTAGEIGERLGLKAADVNKLLEKAGLQVGVRDARSKLSWERTAAAEGHSTIVAVSKQHGGRASVQQVRWFPSVIPIIERVREPAQVAA